MLMSLELNFSFIYIRTLRKNKLKLRSIFCYRRLRPALYHCEVCTQPDLGGNLYGHSYLESSFLRKPGHFSSGKRSLQDEHVLLRGRTERLLCRTPTNRACVAASVSKWQPAPHTQPRYSSGTLKPQMREPRFRVAVPAPALGRLVNTSFLPLMALCSRERQA